MTALATRAGDLAEVSDDDLYQELAKGLTLTAAGLTRLGLVWAELERRGRDLSGLRRGLGRTLPKIAAGHLAAEAVVAFASRPAVLVGLEGMPLDRQRALAAGEKVPTVLPADPSQVERLPLAALPSSRVRVVLCDGVILSPAEQRVRLPGKRKAEPEPAVRRNPRLEDGNLLVGRMAVPLADVLTALASAAGPDRPPPADLPEAVQVARVKLHPEEYESLQGHAKRAGLTEGEMIRKALRAFSLTTMPAKETP